jgi:inosose dehydratase
MKRSQLSYAIWPWGTKTREQAAEAARDVAAIGYSSLEATRGAMLAYDFDHKEYRAMLEGYGLRAVSFFFGIPGIGNEATLFATLERDLDFAATAGAGMVTLQGTFGRPEVMNEAAMAQNLESMHRFARIAKSFGLKTNAHPHVNTYFMYEDEIDYVMENADRDLISLAPDTGHIAAAGGDPVALIRRYADRIGFTHLKDYKLGASGTGAPWVGSGVPIMSCFYPMGEGVLDFAEILGILEAANYTAPLGVELDSPASNIEGARKNYGYLSGYVTD